VRGLTCSRDCALQVWLHFQEQLQPCTVGQ